MEASRRTKTQLGFFLGGLAGFFGLALFQLLRHPETALLLVSLPGPEAFACNLRCLGLAPFLQVLAEGAKALLLIFMSLSVLNALFWTAYRVLKTRTFLEGTERRAVPASSVQRRPVLEHVTVFEDPLPLAFTAGFLRPKIFVSTRLLDALDEDELRGVVLHERHHQETRDPLKALFVSFLSDLLFFLPVSRPLKAAYRLTAEMEADARSIHHQTNPLDLARSLLKVQKLKGPAASWFFDQTTERTKRLLGESSRIPLPCMNIFLTVVVLALSALIALVPVRTGVAAKFVNHNQTCALNSGAQEGPGMRGEHEKSRSFGFMAVASDASPRPGKRRAP